MSAVGRRSPPTPDEPLPTLTQLQYILAVEQTGHFGRAASACHVSQPTLSAQIQKAESELGVVIFDRNSRPTVPTEPGAMIIELARDVVTAHERLIAVASGGLSQPGGTFVLGVIPTLAPYVLPWFLADFAKAWPAVELTILERPTEVILEEISANRMDAAILATPTGEPTLRERVLFYDPFYVYGRIDCSVLRDDAVDIDALDPDQLWLLEDGHCFRAQVVHLCGLGNPQRHFGNVEFAGGNFPTLCGMIDASEGYTLIPETFARTLPAEVRRRNVRPIVDRIPTREVSLVHHRNSWKAATIEALCAAIVDAIPPAFSRELAEGEVMPIDVGRS